MSFTSVSGGGFSMLLRTLTAAVIGGMESLPVPFAAAAGLGIVQELGAWTFHTSTHVNALNLAVILVVPPPPRAKFTRPTATGVCMTKLHWDLFLAVPAAMLVTAVVAALIGLPALRIRGPFLAVTTLAFAVTASTYFLDNRYMGWFVPDRVPRPALWNRVRFD